MYTKATHARLRWRWCVYSPGWTGRSLSRTRTGHCCWCWRTRPHEAWPAACLAGERGRRRGGETLGSCCWPRRQQQARRGPQRRTPWWSALAAGWPRCCCRCFCEVRCGVDAGRRGGPHALEARSAALASFLPAGAACAASASGREGEGLVQALDWWLMFTFFGGRERP